MSKPPAVRQRWYEGISGYQWLVLVIASLGWVFDIFEGQIFVATMREAMPDLLGAGADEGVVSRWNDWAFGSFLLGGAFGGVVFGILGDKIGRSRTMIVTILFYSMFTCVTALAPSPWVMVVLRFFVAMGVGGEWAIASAMVAEVMPQRSRAVMSSIFHASSVFGTLLAAGAAAVIINNPLFGDYDWRIAFAIGALPALLTVFIRILLREPDQWVKVRKLSKADKSQRTGSLLELFRGPNLRSTIVGVGLSSIGLVTFWGIHIYGKNALLRHAQRQAEIAEGVPEDADMPLKRAAWRSHEREIKRAEMASMALNTVGGGLGLVLFGWISNLMGRKWAFIFYHSLAFLMVILLFQVLMPRQVGAVWLMITLPVFGFFTLGMHAGYAVYFPELYPTRVRATGAGFCFNMGRLGTAAAFVFFGWYAVSAETKALSLAPLYLLGVVLVSFARETRDQLLPD